VFSVQPSPSRVGVFGPSVPTPDTLFPLPNSHPRRCYTFSEPLVISNYHHHSTVAHKVAFHHSTTGRFFLFHPEPLGQHRSNLKKTPLSLMAHTHTRRIA